MEYEIREDSFPIVTCTLHNEETMKKETWAGLFGEEGFILQEL